MPLPMPLEPPTTSTCLPLKSSSFIPAILLMVRLTCLRIGASLVNSATRSLRELIMSEFKQLSRSVKGLTVLVTGAASGMGRATARVFAAEGANVAVTDYDEQGGLAVAKEIAASGGAAKAWKLDVADGDEIKRVVGDVAAHFGGLDIIVNNAGISVRVAIDDAAYEGAWARGIAVMLTAHPRIIRAALPHLRKS